MARKPLLTELIEAVVMVGRRCVQLIFYPYKTMRQIAQETHDLQIAIIFGTIFLYYLLVPSIRPEVESPVVQFSLVLFHYLMTVTFIAFFGRFLSSEISVRSLLFLFAYALIPTIIWFFLTSFLFALLPPPRTLSLLGKVFSVVYITISISLLAWKVMLWYLAVRFGTKLRFFTILFLAILYLAVVIPYSFYLYHFGLFRIPFL